MLLKAFPHESQIQIPTWALSVLGSTSVRVLINDFVVNFV
jgi:hypothetical protein